jgi:alpha/beta hydrolase fold
MSNSYTRKASLMAASAIAAVLSMGAISPAPATSSKAIITSPASAQQVTFGSVKIDGLNIAYREAGDPKKPKLVLLHGFPASSHQYRDLIPALADRFHVIAPDYQGFGNSDSPDPATYAYTFDALALTVEKFLSAKGFNHYGLFVQDYGGPVFTPEGGEAFLRDLPKAEMHRLAAGHFAVEGNVPYIASAIKRFHATKVAKSK